MPITNKSGRMVIVLEMADVGEEEPELQVASIMGGRPREPGSYMNDAEWLSTFIQDAGGPLDALLDNEMPQEVKGADVFVVTGHLVAERYDSIDCGTDYDSYFEVEKVLTEEQAVQALGGA